MNITKAKKEIKEAQDAVLDLSESCNDNEKDFVEDAALALEKAEANISEIE